MKSYPWLGEHGGGGSIARASKRKLSAGSQRGKEFVGLGLVCVELQAVP